MEFYDFREMDDYSVLNNYFDNNEDKSDPLASPILEKNLSGLPPACFISAECDPLLDQGVIYAQKLSEFGVQVEYHIMEGMIHGFINSPYEKSFLALDHVASFCNKKSF